MNIAHYEINDATKPIFAGGFEFKFQEVEFFQGKWYGVIVVEGEKEIAAIESVKTKYGIRSISREEWARKSEKKRPQSASSTIRPWNTPMPPISGNSHVAAKEPLAEKPKAPESLADALQPKDIPTPKSITEETSLKLEPEADNTPQPERKRRGRKPRDPLPDAVE